MRLFINVKIKVRKRLNKLEIVNLKVNGLWFNTKHIQIQKCTVPEEHMQELIDAISAVSKDIPIVEWKDGTLEIN